MLLAERIQIRKTPALSLLCHRAKNLYNLANFYVRQELFHLESVLTYYDLNFMLRRLPAYQLLPAQTAQQVLRQVAGNWQAFFAAKRTYQKDPSRFLGIPHPPRYKPKGGENLAIFTNQQCRVIEGWLYFPRKSGLDPIRTRIEKFQQVRVIPKGSYYFLEVIYNAEPTDLRLDKRRALGIDLGLCNVMTIANNALLPPFAINGRGAKSANQFFNKRLAQLQSIAARANGTLATRRIRRLNKIHTNKISDIFHKASRAVVDFCVLHDIGTIAIGYNPRWKQKCNLGSRNNQAFVGLPLHTLVQQLQYKATLKGITTILVDEGYTSRCSFLDGECIGEHIRYIGKRVCRGLFRSGDGTIINADLNAAYNILKKAVPKAFADGIEGVGLHPVLIGII